MHKRHLHLAVPKAQENLKGQRLVRALGIGRHPRVATLHVHVPRHLVRDAKLGKVRRKLLLFPAAACQQLAQGAGM